MATFQKRGSKWRAIVRRKGAPTLTRSFSKKSEAQRWALDTEQSILSGSYNEKREVEQITLGQVLEAHEAYAAQAGLQVQAMRSPFRILREHFGEDCPIIDVVQFQALRALFIKRIGVDRVKPSTNAAAAAFLSSALTTASSSLSLPSPVLAQMRSTRRALAREKLVASTTERDRRVTDAEIALVLDQGRDSAVKEVLVHLVHFAVASAMRQAEICRMRWSDLDFDAGTITIFERKHPTKKRENTQVIPMLSAMRRVLEQVECTDERVFPCVPNYVGHWFSYRCKKAGIHDLVFHDLRHEGISRMFEMGMQIQEVALVSGHRDWRSLRRYTNLRPEDLSSRF